METCSQANDVAVSRYRSQSDEPAGVSTGIPRGYSGPDSRRALDATDGGVRADYDAIETKIAI